MKHSKEKNFPLPHAGMKSCWSEQTNKKWRRNLLVVQENMTIGRANLKLTKNNNLTQTSHPIEYLNFAMTTDEIGRNNEKAHVY